MNVAGCRDALTLAVLVEVEPGTVILIASIPGLSVLKLFAWINRGRENPKDAMDMVTLLRQYHEAGNQDRIYEAMANKSWLWLMTVWTVSNPQDVLHGERSCLTGTLSRRA